MSNVSREIDLPPEYVLSLKLVTPYVNSSSVHIRGKRILSERREGHENQAALEIKQHNRRMTTKDDKLTQKPGSRMLEHCVLSIIRRWLV